MDHLLAVIVRAQASIDLDPIVRALLIVAALRPIFRDVCVATAAEIIEVTPRDGPAS
jgi:hypothetical protein